MNREPDLEAPLRREVAALTQLLDEVVAEQAGPELLATLDEIRQLGCRRRAGAAGAEERLVERIGQLSRIEAKVVVRALSVFFDLVNLAEDHQRVRVLRERERELAPRPRPESLGNAVERLAHHAVPADEVQRLLECLSIELVFTAHPTEAKRRTSRHILRQFRDYLREFQRDDLLAHEQRLLQQRMHCDLTALWQADQIRPQRPGVLDEVRRGLSHFSAVWDAVPRILRDLRDALAAHYPGHAFQIPAFLRFGSWIGGDRDGNPFCTADVTRDAFELLRRSALEMHRSRCRAMFDVLVMSARQVPVDPAVAAAVEGAYQRWPAVRPRLDAVSPYELYRRWLRVIEFRLERALAAPLLEVFDDGAYRTGQELEADVALIARSIGENRGRRVLELELTDWLAQIRTFGLHQARLDLRQDSRVHREVLAEILRHMGIAADYAALAEEEKQQLLSREMPRFPQFPKGSFSETTEETLALFGLLVRMVRAYGTGPIGGHVISMTHHASDVLAVLWLWKWAWQAYAPEGDRLPYLPIVPLFETIDDLRRGPQILQAMLASPVYAEHLRLAERPEQMVMVGYSDSTKDGGYLAASWGLYRAQEKMAELIAPHDVRLVVFHGRGGALGRGGGPTARAILALPPRAVAGALRMTEQGEVLVERYDDPQITYRHLEQVTWATMLVTQEPASGPDPRWTETMETMARTAYEHYRGLVEAPEFLTYFENATPIAEIENLPIASRPARRRERRSLADLRAIPWTFAWTQSRHLLPAWYGVGTAMHREAQVAGNWDLLREMYDRWTHFRAYIDNAQLALIKADLGIAHYYSHLASDHETCHRVWETITREYQLSRSAVLAVTRQEELLDAVAWLQRSIARRNPLVDPLNLIQIELFRRLRTDSAATGAEEEEKLRELLRLTIQGIAAGLRTTG